MQQTIRQMPWPRRVAAVALLPAIMAGCGPSPPDGEASLRGASEAQASVAEAAGAGGDYLSVELRRRVEKLKVATAREPTNHQNIAERIDVLWPWANAYAISGGALPVELPAVVTRVRRQLEFGPPLTRATFSLVDGWIHELQIKDEQPAAIGRVTVTPDAPLPAGSWQTIEQTYHVGRMPMVPGGGILVARQFLSDHGILQRDNPSGDNYLSIRCSNPDARFVKDEVSLRGMHGGFRGAVRMPSFRLEGAILSEGDTITVVYGDRSGGSRGMQQQTFSNDRFLLPIYVDLEGKSRFFTPEWPGSEIVGADVKAVRVFAPSIVAVGEKFELAVRSEDPYYNRATGPIPRYEVRLGDRVVRQIPAGSDPLAVLEDMSFDRPGVYRFGVRSADDRIEAISNPIWVQENPKLRIFWGETHGHSGFAEGQGTPEGYFRFGRDDARLDFLTLSEHDLWMDDYEWEVMKRAVEVFTRQREFIAILGYEWTSPRALGGHHNVFFRDFDRRRVAVQEANTLTELYRGLHHDNHPADVLVIPHAHQAADWRLGDPEMERLVEIFSIHGTFEWFGNMYLRQGHRVGFVAASDDHVGHPGYTSIRQRTLRQRGGLAAVFAAEKTTDAIFSALRNLSAYATSGERILVDFRINDAAMGTRTDDSERRHVRYRVIGTAPLDAIDIIKNGEQIHGQRFGIEELEPNCLVQVGFESSSEAFFRDNPRGYRTWRGVLEVQGARVVSVEALGFQNPHGEHAAQDPDEPNQIRFVTATRGRANPMLVVLEDAGADTRLQFRLEATRESGAAPRLVRPPARIPAAEFTLRLGDVHDGYLAHDLPVGNHRDRITLQLVDSGGTMDHELEYFDVDTPTPGDYYYLRVRQRDGALAWSSPIWVGGEQPR